MNKTHLNKEESPMSFSHTITSFYYGASLIKLSFLSTVVLTLVLLFALKRKKDNQLTTNCFLVYRLVQRTW